MGLRTVPDKGADELSTYYKCAVVLHWETCAVVSRAQLVGRGATPCDMGRINMKWALRNVSDEVDNELRRNEGKRNRGGDAYGTKHFNNEWNMGCGTWYEFFSLVEMWREFWNANGDGYKLYAVIGSGISVTCCDTAGSCRRSCVLIQWLCLRWRSRPTAFSVLCGRCWRDTRSRTTVFPHSLCSLKYWTVWRQFGILRKQEIKCFWNRMSKYYTNC